MNQLEQFKIKLIALMREHDIQIAIVVVIIHITSIDLYPLFYSPNPLTELSRHQSMRSKLGSSVFYFGLSLCRFCLVTIFVTLVNV
jgi:hypothetical protein